MTSLSNLKKEIRLNADPAKAKLLARFFKTGKGQYGEGDVFVGLMVPQSRQIAHRFNDLPFSDIKKLLQSKIHEERLIAILILVHNFETGTEVQKRAIYEYYLRHTHCINNWDLVDLSASRIIGAHLYGLIRSNKSIPILEKLAQSKNIWERRIAIISTLYFIVQGDCVFTLHIAKILLNDSHDLIHKAVGWMLREVGKRCSQREEERFLKKYYKKMPRTMLRYAIERFPKGLKRAYLQGLIRA